MKDKPKKKKLHRNDKGFPVYKTIISRVDCSKGAPTSRPNIGSLEDVQDQRIYNRRVYLNKDGYDTGGVYWGLGDPLYVDFTLDKKYVYFHREHYGN